MNNPKTTIAGYLILGASVLTVAAHFLSGGLSPVDITSVVTGLSGLGLVAATDGGH